MNRHPVRLCKPCTLEWPAMPQYNLCPRCQKNTSAASSATAPDALTAYNEFQRFEAIREFDAKADEDARLGRAIWDKEMEGLLARSFDPRLASGYTNPPTNYGLGGRPANAQDVRYQRGMGFFRKKEDDNA